ncbi:MAG: DUF2786 domain-containing protein [Candidatus Neptunochlamydia sp.]|nr:DUF2786 domain-containing protein [Candidatus Neptunochlamydia sp.]
MEILYSQTILAFLMKVRRLSLAILSDEMGLGVGRTRFYIGRISYPLQFVVFDHPSNLGHFIPSLYEIGINKLYLLESEEEVKNLLRHELAHYITYIEHGEVIASHGKEFKAICKRYGWPSVISKAHIPIDKALKNKQIVDKVRKLLSLSASPQPEEAKQATLKAKELLSKYNLEITAMDDETAVIRTLEKKRSSIIKIQAIAAILHTFFVYPVINHGKGILYLEIIGDRVNVEVAEYVAHFLDKHFETLWNEGRKKDPLLKGVAAKNAFFRGLATGYQHQEKPDSKALVRIEKELIKRVETFYPHLATSKQNPIYSERATKIGEHFGEKLKIREGIKKHLTPLLSWTNLS